MDEFPAPKAPAAADQARGAGETDAGHTAPPSLSRKSALPGTVLTAERRETEELPAATPPATLRVRLKEQAADGTLNAWAILRESAADLRRADRYTQYKAAIVGAWLALSIVGIAVACPRPSAGDNDLGAVLIADHARTEFLIRNESAEQWRTAHVFVNGRYVTEPTDIPPGESLVFTHKQLQGSGGPAPENLVVKDIELRTEDDTTDLMSEGRVLR